MGILQEKTSSLVLSQVISNDRRLGLQKHCEESCAAKISQYFSAHVCCKCPPANFSCYLQKHQSLLGYYIKRNFLSESFEDSAIFFYTPLLQFLWNPFIAEGDQPLRKIAYSSVKYEKVSRQYSVKGAPCEVHVRNLGQNP